MLLVLLCCVWTVIMKFAGAANEFHLGKIEDGPPQIMSFDPGTQSFSLITTISISNVVTNDWLRKLVSNLPELPLPQHGFQLIWTHQNNITRKMPLRIWIGGQTGTRIDTKPVFEYNATFQIGIVLQRHSNHAMLKVFVNGELDTMATMSVPIDAQQSLSHPKKEMAIGKTYAFFENTICPHFEGVIDGVSVWYASLSDADMKILTSTKVRKADIDIDVEREQRSLPPWCIPCVWITCAALLLLLMMVVCLYFRASKQIKNLQAEYTRELSVECDLNQQTIKRKRSMSSMIRSEEKQESSFISTEREGQIRDAV